MDIALAYTVHSQQLEHAPMNVTINGIATVASVRRMVIELTAQDGDHGHTFRLPVATDEDLAKWSNGLAVGASVRLTLTVGDPA